MKKLLTLAALAAVAASCTQSEVEDVKQSNEYIGIASATVNNMVLTRAGETNPLQWGSLGLFVTTEGDDIFKVDNMSWRYTETGWTSRYSNLPYEGEGKQTAYAYHPFSPDVTGTSFKFTTVGYDWGMKNLLWWKSEGALTSNTLNIGFKHAMSKLTINLKKNDEVLNEELGNVIIGGTKVSGTVDLIEQTWKVEDEDPVADFNAEGWYVELTEGFDKTVWAYLIPQEIPELTVSVEVGSKTYTWTAESVQTFEAGYAYTLNLTIGREVTAVGEVTESEWTNTESTEGYADYVPNNSYLTGEELRSYMETQISESNKDITVTLKPTATSVDFWIIREAIESISPDDEGINLTIAGAVFVPNSVFSDIRNVDGSERSVNKLYSINLPDAIELGVGAFFGADNLKRVNAPKVQIIENDAFMSCVNLTEIYFPQVRKIEGPAFQGCDRLSSIEIPEVEEIGYAAFEMTNIPTIDLQKAVTVSGRAFACNNSLTNVNLPLAQRLEEWTFRMCPALTTVIAPKANYIGAFLFEGCTSLETVELTTEQEITMDENAWKSVESEESEAMAINEQVNLVLNKNKEGEVEGNVWKGITFKSITFKE